MIPRGPVAILVREIRSPLRERGEVLAVFVGTRTLNDPSVLVYSVTRDEWRVEHHRHLLWRSKRAALTDRNRTFAVLTEMGERVRIVSASPRAADEMSARW